MATQLLSIGYAQPILQNVVYALPVPGRVIRLTCDDATATFQVSNDVNFTNPIAATLSGTGFDCGYSFMRVTNKNATVNIRRWSM